MDMDSKYGVYCIRNTFQNSCYYFDTPFSHCDFKVIIAVYMLVLCKLYSASCIIYWKKKNSQSKNLFIISLYTYCDIHKQAPSNLQSNKEWKFNTCFFVSVWNTHMQFAKKKIQVLVLRICVCQAQIKPFAKDMILI